MESAKITPPRETSILRKPSSFSLLVFDWDGTAVPDRSTPVFELITALEKTLTSGVVCAVVTGTNVTNLLNQGIGGLSPDAKKNLFICTNRGSETWGFTPNGVLERLFRREATPYENATLDRIVRRLQQQVSRSGLKTEIIYNRLNRRKLDLIPIPEWRDPKKAEFAALSRAVDQRLNSANIHGLSELIEKAKGISNAEGLKQARITSDIKHIEIGLTDKSDSVKWVYDNIIVKRKIPVNRVAILGDEFGGIDGIQGSDAYLRIPELNGAQYFSVGIEPEGVPSWVNSLGGGPKRFITFLEDVVTKKSPAVEEDLSSWQVVQEGFEPSRERYMEALFAIGNGYMGVRATADFPVPAAQPDLLIAGVYDRKAPSLPYSEVEILSTGARQGNDAEIVPIPSPFLFHIQVGGETLHSASGMKTHQRKLDLLRGTYREGHSFEDKSGRRIIIGSIRCASLSDPHLLLQRISLQSENFLGTVEVNLSPVMNQYGPLYPHVESIGEDKDSPPFTTIYRTKGSQVECAIASRIFCMGQECESNILRLKIEPGETIEIERMFGVFTSKDVDKPLESAKKAVSQPPLSERLEAHEAAWRDYWSKTNISFFNEPELAQAQRFNIYHLRSGANTDENSIPAKALTGRAYEGHIFWDTEIFMFPFFLYTTPGIARDLLLYRYKTLDGARKRASEMGYSGACYAWESTVSGLDVTPRSILILGEKKEIPIFTGQQQIHVTADVAHAIWMYWDATLDLEFMKAYGTEILVETARFWKSRVKFIDSAYHILQVVGPDEYHHNVDDNTYTNWMARSNLNHAVAICAYLESEHPEFFRSFISKMGLSQQEISEWKHVADAIFIPNPDNNGVIEQFRGYHSLENFVVPEHEKNRAPVSRLFGWKRINSLQIIKQADFLMLPFLFPHAFPKDIVTKNYDFYEPRTDHGSSLSLCVYAAIAAQIGRFDLARRFWERSLYFDLQDVMTNTALGIHAATMGGAWQTLVLHLLGITFSNGEIKVSRSPSELRAIGFKAIDLKLIYRGKVYPINFSKKGVTS